MADYVIIVDDDRLVADLYARAMGQRGLECKWCRTPAEVLAHLALDKHGNPEAAPSAECDAATGADTAKAARDRLRLVVMDIMLPFAPFDAAAAEQGLTAGWLLFDALDRALPATVPVLFLTNVDRAFWRAIPPMRGRRWVDVLPKTDYPPFAFAELVRDTLEHPRQAGTYSSPRSY